MLTKAVTHKAFPIEGFLILLITAYAFFYYAPIFAEYLGASGGSNIVENIIAQKDSQIAPKGPDWLSIKSAYFTIYYRPTADLKAIGRRLKRRFYIAKNSSSESSDSPEEKLAYSVDMLFNKTKEVLDMRPRNMQLKIRIFKDGKELNDEYYRIFKEKKAPDSFYIHKLQTIYTTEEDISDSVIAHEMGHAIVDHYFLVIPPEKVREILATYVDLHLEN